MCEILVVFEIDLPVEVNKWLKYQVMTKEDIRNLFGDNKQAYIDFETKVNTLPQIRSLEDKFNKLQSGFCYVEAMKLRKRINDIKYQAAKSLIEENDKRERKINQSADWV